MDNNWKKHEWDAWESQWEFNNGDLSVDIDLEKDGSGINILTEVDNSPYATDRTYVTIPLSVLKDIISELEKTNNSQDLHKISLTISPDFITFHP